MIYTAVMIITAGTQVNMITSSFLVELSRPETTEITIMLDYYAYNVIFTDTSCIITLSIKIASIQYVWQSQVENKIISCTLSGLIR